MERVAVWLRLLVAVGTFALTSSMGWAQTAGKDFEVLKTPQPTETPGKVEVIEFFSYTCPHCQNLQQPLAAWLKRKPADVEFKRMPVVFQESFFPFARLYYTLDAMGLTEKLHHDAFSAFHQQKLKLQDPKVAADWAASKGVDRQKFMSTYDSFAVQSLTKRAAENTRRYDVQFTPALVVDGRYLTGPSMTSTGNTVDFDRFFKVLDQMIASARKKGPAK
jgi:thiol:disulfide interchange protein DsbA